MKKLRITSLMLVLVLLVVALVVPVQAASDIVSPPDVANGVYYVDDAQCLSTETKNYINSQNIALTNACGGQVAVVTLEFLNDLDSEEYAYEVMNQWGVGDKDKNNGTVFVLVTAEKKCWITTGSGIEDDLSAGRLETILENNCYDSLDSGNYDAAVYDTVRSIFAWYEQYYNVSLSSYSSTQVQNGEAAFGGGSARGSTIGGIIQSIFSIILMLIVLAIVVVWVAGSICRPVGFWPMMWCGGGPRGPRHHGPHHGPRGPQPPRGGGFGGGFGGGGGHMGGAGRGGFGGGGFGGGSFGGGGGHGGGAGRR